MRIKDLYRIAVSSVASIAMLTGQFAGPFFAARTFLLAQPTVNSIALAMSALALVESSEGHAQTAEQLGSTSGSVDADDPASVNAGRAAAATALGNVQRPGIDSNGFSFRIQRPDGSVWQQDLGTRADGTSYSMSDLDTLRSGYGDSLTSEVQAQNYNDPDATFMRDTFRNHGHQGMEDDPGIVGTENALRQMETANSFQTIYGDCGDLSRGNQTAAVLPNAPAQSCYRVESPAVVSCAVENNIRIRSADNIPTAVVIVVDRSGSMSGSRLEAAKAAALRIAKTLDIARYTKYAVYAYSKSGVSSSEPGDYYPLTTFDESVGNPGIVTRYTSMTASGGTPTSTTMDHLSDMLAARTEPRKVMLVVTDGEPTSESNCPHSSSCNPRGVQSNYSGIIQYAAVGIQLPSVSSYFDTYRVVSSPSESEISTAMYDLLSGATGWFTLYNEWLPQNCISTAQKVEDGRYTGSLTCLDPPDASGCNDIDGLLLCNGAGYANALQAPPVGGFPATCGAVGVNNVRYCWTGVDGIQHCLNDDSTSDVPMCSQYSNDTSCGRISSVCVESSRDDEGNCHVFYEEYACGRNPNDTVTATAGGCGTPVPCMGGECMDDPPETNTNWVDTMTIMQAVEWAGQDAQNCNTTTGECDLFKGDSYSCRTKKFYINIPCCDDPPDISLQAWMTVTKATYKGLQSSGVFDWMQANTIDTPGVWQDIYQGASYVWDSVSQPFISAFDSLSESAAGWLGDSGASASGQIGTEFTSTVLADFKQEVMNQAYRWINEFFPDLANTLFQQSVTASGQATGNYVLNQAYAEYIGSFVSFVMWVYVAYQIANLAYALFANCADNDGKQIEYNYKRERLRVCHQMSSRCRDRDTFGIVQDEWIKGCCFASPLSRILQEQVRAQLGISWGSACSPECGPITLAQLQSVDWGQVDLSEWTAILFESGILPENADEENAYGNEDTATTNKEDPNKWTPPSSNTRFENRSQHLDWEAIQKQYRNDGWNEMENATSTTRHTPYGDGATAPVSGAGGH